MAGPRVVHVGEQATRDYVTSGMEIHWVRPRGRLRPGVLVRLDIMWIDASAAVALAPGLRYDLSTPLTIGRGDRRFWRLGLGPLASNGVSHPGVDRLRLGVVVEANIGWRRGLGLYADARKTWGTGADDVAYTIGMRFDLALLSKLNAPEE